MTDEKKHWADGVDLDEFRRNLREAGDTMTDEERSELERSIEAKCKPYRKKKKRWPHTCRRVTND